MEGIAVEGIAVEGIAVQNIAMKGTVVGFFAVLVRFSRGNFHTYILLMSGCSILNVHQI